MSTAPGSRRSSCSPPARQLAPDTETTIKASTDLAFDVSVKNTGDNQEVRIEVTLTIPKGTTPIVKKQTIDILDIGETKTVTFKDFPDPPFGEKTSVQVSVKPVPASRTRQQQRRVPRHLLARVMDAALAVAIAACVVAVVALLTSALLVRRLRRLQSGQKAVLGGASHDMVDFAVSLQGRIDDLHRAVDEVATGLSRVDRRVDGAITNTAVVRYDAYEDTGGKQSASFAFLDATRTGTVVTAIQGRDYARIYVKDVERGTASVALSPEEQTAVERAMAR